MARLNFVFSEVDTILSKFLYINFQTGNVTGRRTHRLVFHSLYNDNVKDSLRSLQLLNGEEFPKYLYPILRTLAGRV